MYAPLALGFVALSVVLLVLAARLRRPDRAWWAATGAALAALLVVTVVFDSLMIAVDLFRFDESHLTGLRLGLAPVEDLAWPVAAALGLPSLWLLLGGRRAEEEAP